MNPQLVFDSKYVRYYIFFLNKELFANKELAFFQILIEQKHIFADVLLRDLLYV